MGWIMKEVKGIKYTQAGEKNSTENDIILVCEPVKGLEGLMYKERLEQLYVYVVDWLNNESGCDLYMQWTEKD